MFRHRYRLGECRDCGTECFLRRRVPRHELHLALTIATLGFWGLCWIITLIAARWEPWRCTDCRRPQTVEPPAEDESEPMPSGAAIGSTFGLVREHLD